MMELEKIVEILTDFLSIRQGNALREDNSFILLPREDIDSALFSALSILRRVGDKEEINKIVGQSDLYHLAKSYCESQKDYPYGVSHSAKSDLAYIISTWLEKGV